MSQSHVSRRWGLVLSGGAACGLANIGVMDVLFKEGLHPNCIAGSSMGAIVAALHALGYPPSVMIEVAAKLAPASVVRLSRKPLHRGLHGGVLEQELERHLQPLLGEATIAECVTPLVCVAGRVHAPIRWERMLLPGFVQHVRERVEAYVFPPETRILDALRATSAIPVLFSPVAIGDSEFVDLVHFGPIPARTLRRVHDPHVVVATDTQPDYAHFEPFLPSAVREFLLAGRQETELSMAACDLLIRPEQPASMLRFDRADAFAEAGRIATQARLAELRRLIQP